MNTEWNTTTAVGKYPGAVAVVVTLLYLSRQIRQNSRAVHVAALCDTTARLNHWSDLLASSPELAGTVAQGNKSYKSLAEADSLRHGAFAQAFFDFVERYLTFMNAHKVNMRFKSPSRS